MSQFTPIRFSAVPVKGCRGKYMFFTLVWCLFHAIERGCGTEEAPVSRWWVPDNNACKHWDMKLYWLSFVKTHALHNECSPDNFLGETFIKRRFISGMQFPIPPVGKGCEHCPLFSMNDTSFMSLKKANTKRRSTWSISYRFAKRTQLIIHIATVFFVV